MPSETVMEEGETDALMTSTSATWSGKESEAASLYARPVVATDAASEKARAPVTVLSAADVIDTLWGVSHVSAANTSSAGLSVRAPPVVKPERARETVTVQLEHAGLESSCTVTVVAVPSVISRIESVPIALPSPDDRRMPATSESSACTMNFPPISKSALYQVSVEEQSRWMVTSASPSATLSFTPTTLTSWGLFQLDVVNLTLEGVMTSWSPSIVIFDVTLDWSRTQVTAPVGLEDRATDTFWEK
mmetsp:Transcript_42269/g.135315  ORF Transcript_42269/g.135315 Transcript_42269/m.135315 type:complete len:247 (+) Transcript_42269:6201-6941(+)